MAIKSETTKVLILHESRDEAEHLLNLLRNSGRAARGQLIDSDETLANALNTSHWDLMLLRPETEGLTAGECLIQAARISKDIPAILLIDENDSELIVEGLREGFQDVVPYTERERLLLVINRELKSLKERRLRRQAELSLKEAEKRCSALLATSRDAITYVTDGMHTYGNQAYLDLFGYEDPEELEGIPIMDMVAPEHHDAFKQFLRAYASGEHKTNEFACRGLTTDGNAIQCSMVFSSATYDGEPCTQIVIRTNQADAELQEKLKEISSQDLITGLFNRSYFIQEMEQTLEWAMSQSKVAALLYLQLDNFNAVKSNPDIGMGGGDIVLSDIASLLRVSLPNALLARFGDDIFTAVLRDTRLEDANQQAEALRAQIEDHLAEVNERTVRVTTSIGVTMMSEDAGNVHDVLSRAATAIERVRERSPSGNGVAIFDPALERKAGDVGIAERVQEAIDKGLFKILFQAVIDLRGGGGELYEVFVRMMDESGKEITPGEFMGVAQAQEVCEKIDRWVILQSVKTLADHRAKGHETKLIINITSESMRDQTLLLWLGVALKAARMPGDALIFQFSETDATTYLKQAREFTRELKELHCRISISRFGCALNPFNTLKHVEVDYLKLDGSFTKDLSRPESREALKDVVTQAHSLGKLTIASFVESAAVLSSLWQIGVNYIQGYYLQTPTEQMNYDFNSE
jgi:diguanylate cyclase (GGDEF)-like protein/PAS domain S-box-containing protein